MKVRRVFSTFAQRMGSRSWSSLIGLLALSLLLGELGHANEPEAPKQFERGVLIRLEGIITPMREKFLYRKLENARRQGADVVIIEIDSPGGLLEQSQDMAERLSAVTWARTVAYIPAKALSGAAIVALGCDEIIMNPGARLGDAGVVFLDEDFLFRYADEKIRSDVAHRVRELAEAKGRPPALAEAMVDKDLVVSRVRNRTTDTVTYMSDDEIDASENPGQWEKLNPVLESRESKFLVVDGTRAVELQLAQGNAKSRDELRERYRLDRPFVVIEPNAVDTWVYILNLPFVTGLLFVVGLVALYVELSAPGISIGGLLSGLSFALFFWSRFMGGTAEWLEVILFLAGMVFLAVELFVIPGFGVSGLTGILLILISLTMASQTFVIPSTTRQLSTLTTTLAVILASGVIFGVLVAVMGQYLGRIPVLNHLMLRPPGWDLDYDEPGYEVTEVGAPQQTNERFLVSVGDRGVADSPLRPAGKARFGEEYVDVVTDGTYVDEGTAVRVIDVSGNRVMVRKVE